jgi:spore coat polysaccharide biosynthesis protein SpsF
MKIVLIVQARMGSTRLPGKVLLPVMGRPILAYQLDRLKNVKYANEIVIATSDNKCDDSIVEYCEQNNVAFYQGSESDVLSRFFNAATKFKADIVVRLTADCPLIDPAVIDQVIAVYCEDMGQRTYVCNTLERTYPRGMDVEVFPVGLLHEANRYAKTKHDREHVTPYLIRNDLNNIVLRNVTYYKNISAYRFTLDYSKDFKQISSILNVALPDFSLTTLMATAKALQVDMHDNAEEKEEEKEKEKEKEKEEEKESKLLARFGLGSAQFGMYYGKFNRDGVPSIQKVNKILELGSKLGLSCIDTAHLYGESEIVLGHCRDNLNLFSIVTKTPRFSDEIILPDDAVMLRNAFYSSLKAMHQTSIDGLLIHHASNLLTDGGELLYEEMVKLKDEGLVRRIGVSAYTSHIVEKIHKTYPLDFVQLPINILDRRITSSEGLSRIAGMGIKIHARSAFLQGLLLASPDSLSAHFEPVRNILKTFHARAELAGISSMHAALHYLLRFPEIEKIIIGVESLGQLEDIFKNFPHEVEMDFDDLFTDRIEILNPVLWVN